METGSRKCQVVNLGIADCELFDWNGGIEGATNTAGRAGADVLTSHHLSLHLRGRFCSQ